MKGKIGPLKMLQQNPRYISVFKVLGDSWIVSEELYKGLEAFTCAMYGYPRLKDINAVSKAQLSKMVGGGELIKDKKSKVDLTKLAPCANDLRPHIERCNHRAAHIKRARAPMFSSPKPHDENQVSII